MNIISDFFKKRLIMPHELKEKIAINNAKKLLKAETLLIIMSFILLSYNIIVNIHNLSQIKANLIFYAGYMFTGIVGLLLSFLVLKNSDLSLKIKMIPIRFTVTSLLFFTMLSFYYDNLIFITFVLFASISIITPVIFKIEPIYYNSLLILCTIFFWDQSYKNVDFYSSIDIFVFTGICSFLSIYIWENTINDFLMQSSLQEYKNRMDKEIQLASVVQESFFKHEENNFDEWSIVFYSKAMSGVSGDFFDIYNTKAKLDGIGLFDVSGHGISSGLVTMLVKNIIIQEFDNGKKDDLKTVIERINFRFLKEKGNIENYLTGILCKIDGNTVNFINAGHSMPIYYNAEDNSAELLTEERGQNSFGAIGLDIPNNFNSHSIKMNQGDELILFTDGITDAENEKEEAFGKDRLVRSVLRNAERPLSTQINCIISDVRNFSLNMPQKDDITMLILKKK